MLYALAHTFLAPLCGDRDFGRPTGGAVAHKPGVASQPPHCRLLDQLSQEQRQAHRDFPWRGDHSPPDRHTILVSRTIPDELKRAIDNAFLDANPEWLTKELEISRGIRPFPSLDNPDFGNITRPFAEHLTRARQEMHRQCAPGVS